MRNMSQAFRSGVRSLFGIWEPYTEVIFYYSYGYSGLYTKGGIKGYTPTPKKLKVPTHTYASKKILAKI